MGVDEHQIKCTKAWHTPCRNKNDNLIVAYDFATKEKQSYKKDIKNENNTCMYNTVQVQRQIYYINLL